MFSHVPPIPAVISIGIFPRCPVAVHPPPISQLHPHTPPPLGSQHPPSRAREHIPVSRSRHAQPAPAGPHRAVPARPAALAAPSVTVPDICAAAGDEPGRWPGASGKWPGAARAPSTANCTSLPCSRPRQWDALFGGRRGGHSPRLQSVLGRGGRGGGSCPHPAIDGGSLSAIAERLSSAGSSSCLCCHLPLLFLGIQGISAAHRG